MKRESASGDSRLEEIKEILQKVRLGDFENVFSEIVKDLLKLVNDGDSEPLSNYLDENPTIGNILSTERVELGEDTRRNPKTIMSFMRQIFEEHKKKINQ